MAKSKYKFNPESLSYDKVKVTYKGFLIKILGYLVAGIFITIVFNVVFPRFFESPKDKMLKRENEQMKFQYEILNKRLAQAENVLLDLRKTDDNIYRTIFEAEPIPKSVRDAGFGGINKYADLEGFDNSKLVIECSEKLDHILKEVYIQSKSYDELIHLSKNKNEMYACLPAIQPVSNKDLTRTASGWGWRIHPIYKIRKFHYGIDFTSPTGSEIYATGNGVVSEIESSYRGYGNKIIIDHGFGYKTIYGHLNGFNVKPGQAVHRGDIIGFVGNTGLSTAPHLHYEVELNNTKVNPVNYYFNDLSASEYEKMIEISINSGQTFD